MKRVLPIAVLAAAIASSGCSHALTITNLKDYEAPPLAPLERSRSVGVASQHLSDPMARGFVEAVVEGLRRDGSFDRVIFPYDPAVHQELADVVIDVAVAPSYSGRGTNFLVSWPGYLIFAPAIWGYGYVAAIDTLVKMSMRDGYAQRFEVATRYTFRHADMNRTWAELGWLELGIIPLAVSAFYTQYDPDVTPEFVSKVGPSYGSFVVRRIHEVLAGVPTSTAIRPAAHSIPGP